MAVVQAETEAYAETVLCTPYTPYRLRLQDGQMYPRAACLPDARKCKSGATTDSRRGFGSNDEQRTIEPQTSGEKSSVWEVFA